MRKRTSHYYAFDLLWLYGRDLRELPLMERKQRLKRLIRPPVLYVDHIEGRGVDLFEATCAGDLEGSWRNWRQAVTSRQLLRG